MIKFSLAKTSDCKFQKTFKGIAKLLTYKVVFTNM